MSEKLSRKRFRIYTPLHASERTVSAVEKARERADCDAECVQGLLAARTVCLH